MSTFLYTYNWNSAGAAEIAEGLDIRRIRLENSKFQPMPHKVIINWGSSAYPVAYDRCKVLNLREAVHCVSNKKTFFDKVKDHVRAVPATTDIGEATNWIKTGATVCARTKLQGSGGEGLVLLDSGTDFVKAPLYTKYIKKREEYRIHVMNGEVIAQQRKAKRNDQEEFPDADHRIRNLANGYVFVRNDIVCPVDVLTQSMAAVKASNLDFGAVDVIWNEHLGQAFVLEINTAPGLSGTTITDYVEGFKKVLGDAI